MYNSYLAHFGIKGQRWGHRKYQNEDGSLTPEGIKRYRKNTDRIAKAKAEAERAKRYATKREVDAEVYASKRDKVKSRFFQTDISIAKADSLDRKRARAANDAALSKQRAIRLEESIRRLERENASLLTSDPKVSKANKEAVAYVNTLGSKSLDSVPIDKKSDRS